jgi:pectate lyase
MRLSNITITALTMASVHDGHVEKRAAKVDELVGFATGTTGGGNGSGTTVTSCAALTAAAKTGSVIKISGTLTRSGIIELVSQTSALGIGSNAGLRDGGFQILEVSNIVIRNLKLYRAPEGKDLIDIDASTKIWVDHCDLSSSSITGDKDFYDDPLDAKHGSDMLIFS